MNFTESAEVLALRETIAQLEAEVVTAQAPLNDRVIGRRWFGTIMIREDQNGHHYEWTNADLANAKTKSYEVELRLEEARNALEERLEIEKLINDAVAAQSEMLLEKTFEAIDVLLPGARGLAAKYAAEAKNAIKANNKAIARLNSHNGDLRETIVLAARLGSKVRE